MSFVTEVCVFIEIILIAYQLLRSITSKDPAQIWSPLNIVSITYIYYCIIPHFFVGNENFIVNEEVNNAYLFHIAALVSYFCILVSFSRTKSRIEFPNWNSCFDETNTVKYGLMLFLFGFIGYGLARGFHFSIARTEKTVLMEGGMTYYILCLTEFFPVALALLLAGLKYNKFRLWLLVPIWLIFVTMIFSGSRGRIIIGVISLLVMWYSYQYIRKVKYVYLVAIIILMYLGFSVMDKTRSYGAGIDLDATSSLQIDDISNGAQENYSVYEYSIMSMDNANSTGERYYFKPLVTALLMPLPRSLFPWKPDASYMKQMENQLLGNTDSGAAYLNFVESYISFGWIGVIFWALIFGWLARVIWGNFDRNRSSLGAIILLGVFDGMVYLIISRGYLAQSLSSLLYGICLPFWIVTLCNKISSARVKRY